MIPTENLYSFQSGGRTLYLHADSFDHAQAILLEAVDNILTADWTDQLGQLVSVVPEVTQ